MKATGATRRRGGHGCLMQNIGSFVDEAAAAAGRSGIDQPLRRSETGRVGVGGFDAPANLRWARDHHGRGNCRGFAAEASESELEAGDLEQRPRRSPCLPGCGRSSESPSTTSYGSCTPFSLSPFFNTRVAVLVLGPLLNPTSGALGFMSRRVLVAAT